MYQTHEQKKNSSRKTVHISDRKELADQFTFSQRYYSLRHDIRNLQLLYRSPVA